MFLGSLYPSFVSLNNKETNIAQPELRSTTMRLPMDVWEALAKAAIDERTTQQQIIINALRNSPSVRSYLEAA